MLMDKPYTSNIGFCINLISEAQKSTRKRDQSGSLLNSYSSKDPLRTRKDASPAKSEGEVVIQKMVSTDVKSLLGFEEDLYFPVHLMSYVDVPFKTICATYTIIRSKFYFKPYFC